MNVKNIKMVTKLCISFIVVDFLLVLSLFLGYRTAQTIVTVDDPVSYLSSFATFTAIEFIAMQISIGGIVAVVVINIKKSILEEDNLKRVWKISNSFLKRARGLTS